MKKFFIFVFCSILLTSCCSSINVTQPETTIQETSSESTTVAESIDESTSEAIEEYWIEFNVPEGYLVSIPYSNDPYYVVNDNVPYFILMEYPKTSFEEYGQLDALGRCTLCIANIG